MRFRVCSRFFLSEIFISGLHSLPFASVLIMCMFWLCSYLTGLLIVSQEFRRKLAANYAI